MEEILPPEIMEHIFEQFKYCSYCEPLKTTYHKLQAKCIEKIVFLIFYIVLSYLNITRHILLYHITSSSI